MKVIRHHRWSLKEQIDRKILCLYYPILLCSFVWLVAYAWVKAPH